MNDLLKKDLQKISNLELRPGEDLTRYSTLQLKSHGDLVICKCEDALKELVKALIGKGFNYQILGNGSNTLLPEEVTTIIIKLDLPFDRDLLRKECDEYILPASVPLNILTAKAIKAGLKGWDSFTGIPGTLGGSVCMNAGTSKGEIGSIVKNVKVFRKEILDYEYLTMNGSEFEYRKNLFLNEGDIITSVTLTHLGIDKTLGEKIKSYLKHRTETQPLWEKTCGCTFKNLKSGQDTCAAGRVIDILGLKGLSHKSLKVSKKHGNFIENTGEATKKDYLELIDIINSKVLESNGYEFEPEVVSFI